MLWQIYHNDVVWCFSIFVILKVIKRTWYRRCGAVTFHLPCWFHDLYCNSCFLFFFFFFLVIFSFSVVNVGVATKPIILPFPFNYSIVWVVKKTSIHIRAKEPLLYLLFLQCTVCLQLTVTWNLVNSPLCCSFISSLY